MKRDSDSSEPHRVQPEPKPSFRKTETSALF